MTTVGHGLPWKVRRGHCIYTPRRPANDPVLALISLLITNFPGGGISIVDCCAEAHEKDDVGGARDREKKWAARTGRDLENQTYEVMGD